jgi:hypothetical protein
VDRVDEIKEAVRLAGDGNVAEAREALDSLWQDLTERPDALVECVLAHHMADLQDDPREELHWDLRSLAAADRVTDERAAEQDIRGGRLGLYPSIHLNLAEDHLKLDDRDGAKGSVIAAAEHLGVLPDDDYGRRIRAGFARLEAQVAEDPLATA